MSPERKRCKRSHSRSIISPHHVKKHQKESLSPARKRCKRSHSRSIISPHDVEKHQKESLSPERKRLQRSRSRSVISRSRSPKNLGHSKSKESAHLAIKSSWEDSSVKRSRSRSPKNLGHTKSKESAHLAIKSSREDSSVKRSWSRSPKHVGHTGSRESAHLAIKSSQENSSIMRSRSQSPRNLSHTRSKESAHQAIKSSREDSLVKRSCSRSPKHVGHTGSQESAHVEIKSSRDNSSFSVMTSQSMKMDKDYRKPNLSSNTKQNVLQENSSVNTHKSRSPNSRMNRRESRFSHRQAHVQVLSSSLEDSSCHRRSRSPESIGINTSRSPDAEVGVFEQQNSLLNDTNSGPIAASSSIDEQVLKGKFCTDTASQGEISTLSGCPFECDDEQRSLSELKSHIQLHHAEKNPAGETPRSSSNTTSANLLCPFECTDKPFETKNDRKEHLIKVHSCTPTSENSSTKDENRKGTRLGKDMNVIDERIAQEKNEIRKTYISNPHGLTPYKFRKLIRENDLQEVSVRGNGYCFISCIIITLAELGINKTLEVLSAEVMAHIRQHKEDFYSNFQVLSKLEDEVENLIECCAKYFEGGAYFTNSVDVCIPAIATTLGVNLNLFQKDPTTKLVTLTRYDCNEYNSSINLFFHYYPGSKHRKGLDAHYNCYVNSQYHKQNAAAISSRMVRTIEEEEAAKALTSKNQNKRNTAVTSRNVSTTTKPQKEASKIQNNGNTAASLSTVNTVMEHQKQNLSQKSHAASSVTRKLRSSTQVQEEKS